MDGFLKNAIFDSMYTLTVRGTTYVYISALHTYCCKMNVRVYVHTYVEDGHLEALILLTILMPASCSAREGTFVDVLSVD